MESTLITFINNSSNVFRIIILYLIHVSIDIRSRQIKVFYNNLFTFTKNWYTMFKTDTHAFHQLISDSYADVRGKHN